MDAGQNPAVWLQGSPITLVQPLQLPREGPRPGLLTSGAIPGELKMAVALLPGCPLESLEKLLNSPDA